MTPLAAWLVCCPARSMDLSFLVQPWKAGTTWSPPAKSHPL
jgi:hypothetical protein